MRGSTYHFTKSDCLCVSVSVKMPILVCIYGIFMYVYVYDTKIDTIICHIGAPTNRRSAPRSRPFFAPLQRSRTPPGPPPIL